MYPANPVCRAIGSFATCKATFDRIYVNASLPEALEQVALIAADLCASTGAISKSQWLTLVREGIAPPPAISSTRFTRWRLQEVATFWAQAPERLGGKDRANSVQRQAQTASAAACVARAKRLPAQPESIQG